MNVSISRNGTELGEWSEDQVRALYKEERLLPTDHYWREGMSEWRELRTFIKPPLPIRREESVIVEDGSPSDAVLSSLTAPDQMPELVAPIVSQNQVKDWKAEALALLKSGARLVVAIIFGKLLFYYFPTATIFLVIGSAIGFSLGLLPYLVARYYYKSPDYKRYYRYAYIGVLTTATLALAYMPTYNKNQVLSELYFASYNLNRSFPKMLDSNTRADSTSVGPGLSFHYHYTILDAVQLGDIGEATSSLQSYVHSHKTYLTRYCSDNGVSLEYDYSDKDGLFIAKVLFTPEELK